MYINTDPYSGCALDHAPKGAGKMAYKQLRFKLAIKYGSDSRTSLISPIDASCLSDNEIVRIAKLCAKLRMKGVKHG